MSSERTQPQRRAGRKPWRGVPLPHGKHGLSPEFVKASQRERIVRAMLTLVSERGYAATTVPAVVAAARVSRNAFYEFFADKEDCFLTACEDAKADMLATMQTFGLEADWVEGVRRGIRTYLRWFHERPGLARAYLVELPLVGARAAEQRRRVYEPFEVMFAKLAARIRRERPDLPELPAFVPPILVMSLLEMLSAEVRAGRGDRLPEAEDAAVFVTVKLLSDDATAHEALRRKAGAAVV